MDIIHYGLGPIGVGILDLALRSDSLNVRGAVDIDPEKVGRDVGALLGGPDVGTRVVPSVDDLPSDVRNTVGITAVHAAGSRLEVVWPHLRDLLGAGYSVVSTCEELAFPWHRHERLSEKIDAYARERGLAVLGTGVNPGFVMDVLPVCVTAAFGEVRKVRVIRAVDVSRRRVPLQRKVGVGMAREEFESLATRGDIGHVGLEESARLLAHGLGWKLAEVVNTIEPTTTQRRHRVALGELAPGDVDGLAQTCVATASNGNEIELELTMRVGAEQRDEIIVTDTEDHRVLVPDGLPGDTATAAIALNCAKRMDELESGLVTMVEAGLPRLG